MSVYMPEIAGGVDDVSDTLFELFRFWRGLVGVLGMEGE